MGLTFFKGKKTFEKYKSQKEFSSVNQKIYRELFQFLP